MTLPLRLRGVRTRNLRDVDLDIAAGTWTVFAGVSGCGKSSLAFGTLHAAARGRFLSLLTTGERTFLEQLPRPLLRHASDLPASLALRQEAAAFPARDRNVLDLAELAPPLEAWAVARGTVRTTDGQAVTPRDPGVVGELLKEVVEGTPLRVTFDAGGRDPAAWSAEGFLRARLDGIDAELDVVDSARWTSARVRRIVVDRIPWSTARCARAQDAVAVAQDRGQGVAFIEAPEGMEWTLDLRPAGSDPALRKRLAQGSVVAGFRLTVGAIDWRDLLSSPLEDIAATLPPDGNPDTSEILEEARMRLRTCLDLGLGYLEGLRLARSLSLGERHRLQLAALLAVQIPGVLLVLDEPLAGLHPSDAALVLDQLANLRNRGITLVTVLHNLEAISRSDRVVELGPGAGSEGGRIVYDGSPDGLSGSDTPTGRFLARLPSTHQPACAPIGFVIEEATVRHLHVRNLRLPREGFVGLCGPSGAGKSTLALDVVAPALRALRSNRPLPEGILVTLVSDRSPPPVTVLEGAVVAPSKARGRVASASGVLGPLRLLWASLPTARVRGFGPAQFSPHTAAGRCPVCRGAGGRLLDPGLFSNIFEECASCTGSGLRREILDVRRNGRPLQDVFAMTVSEALDEFRSFPPLLAPLRALNRHGLGHLTLGRRTASLSGGEFLRLRLAAALGGDSRAGAVWILDEPSLGLHPADTLALVDTLQAAAQAGHLVLAVSHDPVLLARCDLLVELGPGAGPRGGRILACGAPAEIARGDTATSAYLRSQTRITPA